MFYFCTLRKKYVAFALSVLTLYIKNTNPTMITMAFRIRQPFSYLPV